MDYAGLSVRAATLLASAGGPITIQRTTGAAFNAVTGQFSGGTVSSLTSTGAILPFSDSVIDGTRIQKGDKQIILDQSVTPVLADKFLVDGEYWNCLNVETISPNGINVIHKVHIRK
jgi:hypothetical protein